MFSLEKFTCRFTSDTNDVLEITGVVYIGGKIKWRTIQYPTTEVRKVAEKVLSFNNSLLERENKLPEHHRIIFDILETIRDSMSAELLATSAIQLLTATGDENKNYNHIVRAVVLLIFKECFELLTPVVYYGHVIKDEDTLQYKQPELPLSTPELPDDVILEVYKNIESLSLFTMFEMTSKVIKRKSSKPRGYERYISLSPNMVLTEALKEHNKAKDPLVRERLLLIIVNAIKEGALLGIDQIDPRVIFSIRDLFILRLILTEIVSSFTLFFRISMAESNITCRELAGFFLTHGRTDIIQEFMELGILRPFDQYDQGYDDIRTLSASLKARFIPDNFVSFMEPLSISEDVPDDTIFNLFPKLLFASIIKKKFTLSYHPDLLVDAISKGYINLQHPIRDVGPGDDAIYGGFSKELREASEEDRELIYKHLEDKAIPTFHKSLEECVTVREEYLNATDFLIFLEPEELCTMPKIYSDSNTHPFPLRNGNHIFFDGYHFETVTKLPCIGYTKNEYVVRGDSTPKEICEFYENLREVPSTLAIETIRYVLGSRNNIIGDLPLSLYITILDKCVLKAIEITKSPHDLTENARTLIGQTAEILSKNPLFEKVVFSRRYMMK